MNVGEIMERLQELLEAGAVTAETEVLLATQPRYPLENRVSGLATLNSAFAADAQMRSDDDETGREPQPARQVAPAANTVYICEGSQVGYCKSDPWQAAEMGNDEPTPATEAELERRAEQYERLAEADAAMGDPNP